MLGLTGLGSGCGSNDGQLTCRDETDVAREEVEETLHSDRGAFRKGEDQGKLETNDAN